MPGCILHACGDDFDVDGFLTISNLQPYSVYHRGEPRPRSKLQCENGFKIAVTEHGKLKEDVPEAISFLSANEAELLRLRDFPGVKSLCLDFGHWQRDVAVQCDYLPSELLVLAGKLGFGIALSLYPASDDEMEAGGDSADQPL
ncbi:MAG: hypothetical protein JWO89_1705 [Verrucomicrobiaceae bacterium]|nr:hypothetical protein [Verrucomicrobiaceae bacterium]MDB6117376.1 hypothetical protein [Verrucomicrobiaceae bacterium]